jgi:assimilatory nitrate reductase catalytic subunit
LGEGIKGSQPSRLPEGEGTTTAEAWVQTKRLFAQGDFFTANRRARIVPVSHQPTGYSTSDQYPFVLNTGRIRDQWHTMSRTGLTARLTRHIGEPFAELHPQDAKALGVSTGDILHMQSAWGAALARVTLNDGQQRGMVFVPIHWNAINSSKSRMGALVNPVVDRYSGQPELKFTPVALIKAVLPQQGFVITQHTLPLLTDDAKYGLTGYAVNVRLGTKTGTGSRQELALLHVPVDTLGWLEQEIGLPADVERIEYVDEARGVLRAAWLQDDVLIALAMLGPAESLPARGWLDGLIGQAVSPSDRRSLLSGVAADPAADIGPIVCSCFAIGRNTICNAIKDQKLSTVAMVGQCLKAGTNCGSCQSEIAKLIEQRAPALSPALLG